MIRKVMYWLVLAVLAFCTFNSDMAQPEKTAFGHLLSVWVIFGISVSVLVNTTTSHFQKIKYILIAALISAVFAYGGDADDDKHRKQKTIGVIAKLIIGGYAGVLTREYLEKKNTRTAN